ncbi:MAG: PhnE/PtxC family ABC transporter permease [Ilumatobacter sp.]
MLGAALAFAISRAGLDDVVNANGWSSFARFWSTVLRPEVSAEFLRLTWDAALTTLAFALLGSILALIIGLIAGLALAERMGGSTWARRVLSVVGAAPRSVHEILIALLLVQVFGFDPIVAVLAIGIPFGAVTAKVFADAIDDADRASFDVLVASGARRLTAVVYGVGPHVRGELVGYSFYRFECAIRSAAVLGIAGVGGLGFQLDLSFESLRYREIWTLIAALMLLSGVADAVSSSVRRSSRRLHLGWITAVGVSSVMWSAWQVGLDVSSLWSPRTRQRLPEFADDLLPPRLGPGGWNELWSATLDTAALAVLSLVVAVVLGLIGAVVIRRPPSRRPGRPVEFVGASARRGLGRVVLLLFRAVPAPVWAFLFVLVLFPGLWPGAVALGVYNAGVLGRLFAEAIESQPSNAEDLVTLAGGRGVVRWAYGVLPQAAPRLTSLSLYRGEVIVRETIVIGVVGAGGLGQLVRDHLVARDFAAVTGVVLVLVALAVAADSCGAALRRTLR